MGTVSEVGAGAAFSSTLAQAISQTNPVQTSKRALAEGASHAALYTDSIASMSSSSMGSIAAAPSLSALQSDSIFSASLASQLSLTKTQVIADKTEAKEEKKAKQAPEKTVSFKFILPSQCKQVMSFAKEQLLQVLNQNESLIAQDFILMQSLEVWGRKLAEAIDLGQKLTPEESAVSQWIAKFAVQQIDNNYKILIPVFTEKVEGFTLEKYNSIIKLIATLIVMPKAAEICAKLKQISSNWVQNLLSEQTLKSKEQARSSKER
jgi:hypothetical protein